MTKLVIAVALSLVITTSTSAAPVRWETNNNHYDLVLSSFISWNAAKTAAEGLTFQGVPGHLATITSSDENDFINSNLNTGVLGNLAWTGGHEPLDDGVWRWAVGPESGIQYSNGTTPTAPFNYANWDGVEPNDVGTAEDYMSFNIGTSLNGVAPGGWVDSPETPGGPDPIIGYLVEYETVPEPSAVVLALLGLTAWLGRRRHKKSD